jgi:hypothetical protein
LIGSISAAACPDADATIRFVAVTHSHRENGRKVLLLFRLCYAWGHAGLEAP